MGRVRDHDLEVATVNHIDLPRRSGDDIVERLRLLWTEPIDDAALYTVISEAADAIEARDAEIVRLRAEVERLRAAGDRLDDSLRRHMMACGVADARQARDAWLEARRG